MEKNKPQKRICKGPYKKWTDLEQQKLINFLKDNRPIEKPTAQAYYRRYLNENGVAGEWQNVRAKVKNMRQAFRKSQLMVNSTGWGAVNENETTRGKFKCKIILNISSENFKFFIFFRCYFEEVSIVRRT